MPLLLKRGPSGRAGLTFIEIIAASVITAMLAGAMLIAFSTAARVSSQSNQNAEAASLLQQTIERFRNQVACDNNLANNPGTPWFDNSCGSTANFTDNDPSLPAGYTSRTYTVQAQDCDGAAGADCFKVTTKIHWDPAQ